MHPLLAQVIVEHQRGNGIAFGWGIGEIAIAVVVIAAVIAVVVIALREFGVAIPRWALQVLGVLIVAFIVIIAIKLLLSM